MSLTIDNRDLSGMNEYLEDRVKVLRDALANSEREASRWFAAANALTELCERKQEQIDSLNQQLDITTRAFVNAMENR